MVNDLSEILLDAKKKNFWQREILFSDKIAKFFCFLIALFFGFCIAFTFYLSVFSFEKFSQKSQKNQFLLKEIQTERGVIFDRNYEKLVENVISFNLYLDKKKFLESKISLEELEKFLGQNNLKEKIEKEAKEKVLILENLSQKKLFEIESQKEKFPFLEIKKVETRNYKDSEIFAPILGFVRQDQEKLVGALGIEGYYDEILKPQPGKIVFERTASGKIIQKKEVQEPKSGKSIALTIDARLQRKAFELLKETVEKYRAKGGAFVALDPKTGEILTLVSFPSFDNNAFSFQKELEIEKILKGEGMFNRAIAGEYLVGSIIKPLIALAALEEGKILPEKTIECQGKITIPHAFKKGVFFEYKDWAIHGLTDMKKAIAESCNVYFYLLGKTLGPTKIKEYLEKVGWGKKTGIDLIGEKEGFLPDPRWKKEKLKEGWWDGDSMLYAIGQEYLKVTPLQVVTSYQVFTNEGIIFKPHLLKEIVDEQKNVLEKKEKEMLLEVKAKKENIYQVKEGMKRAVTGENAPLASAKILKDLPFSVAAKTGTAEVQKGLYNVWVTAFAPYEDPQILLTIVIEKVRGLSLITLPVAKEFFSFWAELQKGKNLK